MCYTAFVLNCTVGTAAYCRQAGGSALVRAYTETVLALQYKSANSAHNTHILHLQAAALQYSTHPGWQLRTYTSDLHT
jgi:hypothetical protein